MNNKRTSAFDIGTLTIGITTTIPVLVGIFRVPATLLETSHNQKEMKYVCEKPETEERNEYLSSLLRQKSKNGEMFGEVILNSGCSKAELLLMSARRLAGMSWPLLL